MTNGERNQAVKFAAVWIISEQFIHICQTCYSISEYAAIDEKVEGYRRICFSKQYVTSKPKQFGIKVFVLVYSHCYNREIHDSDHTKLTVLVKLSDFIHL
jgi:hypothetical protein